MTLSVGLTGNAASGKSTVAALFAQWGARLIDADRIVHTLQAPGSPVFDAIVTRFGPGVVAPDGTLDRTALRQLVLGDPALRGALEAIVHPAVAARRDELLAAARAAGVPIVIQDIPLLFEVMDPAQFDAVVLVDAPEATRRRRLVEERGLPPEEADRLMASQRPASDKRTRSDFVIDNTGSVEALQARAREVWDALQSRAPHRA